MRQAVRSYLRRQNGGGSVMVWGAFSAAGKVSWPFCVSVRIRVTIFTCYLHIYYLFLKLTIVLTLYFSNIMLRFMPRVK